MTYYRTGVLAILLGAGIISHAARQPLFLAPLYIEYTSSSPEQFAKEASELKKAIGTSRDIVVGFSVFLNTRFRRADLNLPIDRSVMLPTLDEIDFIVERARLNGLPVHISIVSGFFHGYNTLRAAAIRQDVRNAQWFSDGWIGPPEDFQRGPIPRSAWITPSRYARPLRQRMEESARILGRHLGAAMQRFPDTLLSISGDAEVELSFERNLAAGERPNGGEALVYTDYSPFMIAEFRDWLRSSRYDGDLSPASDENRDGHTFNKDFRRDFRTWRLRFFDESGPLPYDRYRSLPQKLPQSGPYFADGGFDAPRVAQARDPYWEAWKAFRIRVIANYLQDFAKWISEESGIPASRFYTHQIPADFLFAGKNKLRLETSASPLETAFIQPLASAGVTVFNTFNGKTHSKTANAGMFRLLAKSGPNWGILEYNPSVPAVSDEDYYLGELRSVYSFHPTILVPFAWTNAEEHQRYRIQGSAFERALKRFVEETQR